MSGQLHAPADFTPSGRAPGTHWIGGWVDPRVGLDEVEKRKFLNLPGLELPSLGRPTHSQSLYRLRYPGSLICEMRSENGSECWLGKNTEKAVAVRFEALSQNWPGGAKESAKGPIRIASVQADIRTGISRTHFRNVTTWANLLTDVDNRAF
jgi:hypothetical protein